MEEDSIKDTIGAGDSFIAGFLHSVAYTDEGLRAAIENGVSRKVYVTFASFLNYSFRYRLLKA